VGKYHTLTCQVPRATYLDLRAIAQREDRSVSSIVRTAILRTLAERGEAAPRRKGAASQDERTAGATHESA
jgi:hypothetical protein